MLFGVEPPLYTKPAGYVPPPATTAGMQGMSGAASGSGPSSSNANNANSNPYAAYGVQQQQQQPMAAGQQQQQQPPPPGGPTGGFFARPPTDPVLAGHSIWGGAYAAASGSGNSASSSRPPGSPAGAAAAAGVGGQRPPSPYGGSGGTQQQQQQQSTDPKQLQVDGIKQQFQVCVGIWACITVCGLLLTEESRCSVVGLHGSCVVLCVCSHTAATPITVKFLWRHDRMSLPRIVCLPASTMLPAGSCLSCAGRAPAGWAGSLQQVRLACLYLPGLDLILLKGPVSCAQVLIQKWPLIAPLPPSPHMS